MMIFKYVQAWNLYKLFKLILKHISKLNKTSLANKVQNNIIFCHKSFASCHINMLLTTLMHIILNAHAYTTMHSETQFSHIFLFQLLQKHYLYSLPWYYLAFPWWEYIIYMQFSLPFSSYSTIIKLVEYIIKIMFNTDSKIDGSIQ